MSKYGELFKFSAKIGALEGYLFQRDSVESLVDWTSNIESMYHGLPADIQKDIEDDFREVLRKILKYGDSVLEPELKERLGQLAKVNG